MAPHDYTTDKDYHSEDEEKLPFHHDRIWLTIGLPGSAPAICDMKARRHRGVRVQGVVCRHIRVSRKMPIEKANGPTSASK
jgi:hypothetical protein